MPACHICVFNVGNIMIWRCPQQRKNGERHEVFVNQCFGREALGLGPRRCTMNSPNTVVFAELHGRSLYVKAISTTNSCDIAGTYLSCKCISSAVNRSFSKDCCQGTRGAYKQGHKTHRHCCVPSTYLY
jgi:hypothetical protein